MSRMSPINIVHRASVQKRNVLLSSGNNLLMRVDGEPTVVAQILSSISLIGFWEGTMDDIDATKSENSCVWSPLNQLVSADGSTAKYDPGDQITTAGEDWVCGSSIGCTWVRFYIVSGTGEAHGGITEVTLTDIAEAAVNVVINNSGGNQNARDPSVIKDDSAFTPASGWVQGVGFFADEASPDSVNEGDLGAGRMSLDRHQYVTSPADTPYHLVADGTDELLVSASARRLTSAQIFHINDAPVFAKWYDKATAASESDTPIWVTGGPANSTAANGAGNNSHLPPGGIALTNGLSVRVVKGLADNSDTAADAAEVIVNAAYSTRV